MRFFMATRPSATGRITLAMVYTHLGRKIDVLGTRIKRVEHRLENVEVGIGRLEGRMDGIERRMGCMERRIDTMAVGIHNIDKRLDDIELEFLPKRMKKLEDTV